MITSQVKTAGNPNYMPVAHHLGMDLAGRLRRSLEQSGMTASQLARASGVVPQTIGKLLDGSNKNFSCPSVFAIATALNVSAEWLATGKGQIDRRAPLKNQDQARFLMRCCPILTKPKRQTSARR